MRARFDGGFCVSCRGRIFRDQEIFVEGPRRWHQDCRPRAASTVPLVRRSAEVHDDGKWDGRKDLA
jgi:hypothetical protein